jgi:hypothetical protein
VNGGRTWYFLAFILSKPAFNSFPTYALNAADFDDRWDLVIPFEFVPSAATNPDCLAKC